MARYIDADALIKYIFPYDVVDQKCYSINAKAVYEAIKKAPTADVVPKSEVDDWIVTAKENLIRIEELENALKQAKAEVAWEIFEDIERLIELYTINTPFYMPFNYIDVMFAHFVAELKKEYTEEGDR